MPWFRDDPEPLRAKRRELAEKERALAARMSQLTQELRNAPEEAARKLAEPPVWRLEEEKAARLAPEDGSARPRDLAYQRQRDKFFFFLLIGLLLLVTFLFYWLYHTHLRSD